MQDKTIHVISIFVGNRQKRAAAVNQVLTDHGHIILGRMGIPLSKGCVNDCSSVITLVAQASEKEIKEMEEKLAAIAEIKTCRNFFNS